MTIAEFIQLTTNTMNYYIGQLKTAVAQTKELLRRLHVGLQLRLNDSPTLGGNHFLDVFQNDFSACASVSVLVSG